MKRSNVYCMVLLVGFVAVGCGGAPGNSTADEQGPSSAATPGTSSAQDQSVERSLSETDESVGTQVQALEICTIGNKKNYKVIGCCYVPGEFRTKWSYQECVASTVPGGLPGWQTRTSCALPHRSTCPH
jgi:hypothetical protein